MQKLGCVGQVELRGWIWLGRMNFGRNLASVQDLCLGYM